MGFTKGIARAVPARVGTRATPGKWSPSNPARVNGIAIAVDSRSRGCHSSMIQYCFVFCW